ncbi:MAG: hypothetical protein AMXMBFR64_06550 [Myxococcales bacterium]
MKQFYRKYETVFIVRPELADEDSTKVWERVEGVLTRMGGREIKRETWGKRKLAYEVAKNKKGLYLYLRYLGANDLVLELERNLRLMDDVLKFQTVKLDDDISLDTFDFEADGAVVTLIPDGGDELDDHDHESDSDSDGRRPRLPRSVNAADDDDDDDDDDD